MKKVSLFVNIEIAFSKKSLTFSGKPWGISNICILFELKIFFNLFF